MNRNIISLNQNTKQEIYVWYAFLAHNDLQAYFDGEVGCRDIIFWDFYGDSFNKWATMSYFVCPSISCEILFTQLLSDKNFLVKIYIGL